MNAATPSECVVRGLHAFATNTAVPFEFSPDPSVLAAEREVDGLEVSNGKTPAEQLLFENKTGAAVSLRGTEAVPLRPPLQVWLVHIRIDVFEREVVGVFFEEDIEKGADVRPLQGGFVLPRDPCREARVDGDRVLAKEGDEVQVLEGVFAGLAALAAAARSVALLARLDAGTADARLGIGSF